ncbi:hypothetical protein Tco_0786608 [Tanacetum coccineum]
MRTDLQLEDAEGVDCLPNATIFEQLTLMGQSDLVSKRIERNSELKNKMRDEYIKNRQSVWTGIEVNAARHNLLLLLEVNAVRHKLTTAVGS